MRAFVLALAFAPTAALAIECPAPMQQCTVLFLSPQEVQILVQPNGILPTAAEGRKVDWGAAVQYLLQKIKEAPQGEPHKEPVPNAEAPAESKQQ